ncbi:MAG TPA: PAS-domain containing protein [Rhodocyclaceae bacterium]
MTPDISGNPHLLASLDLLDQGLAVFDANLQMVAWNRPFVEMLDFPPELAFVGSPFESLVRFNVMRGEYGVGDREEQVRKRVAAVARHKSFSGERTRPNGQILSIRGEPLPDGGLAVLYTDITSQRLTKELIQQHSLELEERVSHRTAELEKANRQLLAASNRNTEITAALRRSEERLRLITDTIPALIGYFDKNLVYSYANKGYLEWFGCTPERMLGRTIEEAIGTKYYSVVRDNVLRAIGTGQRLSYEYALERPDGSINYARSTLVPEVAADGEVLGCFVLAFDVTEQKRTQAALVQAQKMEAVGQLTGGIAHDFNNSLTVVIGNLAALHESRADDAALLDSIDPVLQAAERGVSLIRRLLTFSRQQPLEPYPVQVAALVQDMIRLLRRSLPETIEILAVPGDTALHAMVDPHQLESALLNLALNARDAMPGGGWLRIGFEALNLKGRVCEELQVTPGRYVAIAVSDNGSGMSPATIARAFEPFFTTKSFGSGSGLGLSMVYGFVRQSGGGIRIVSAPGQGSTVELLLPRAEAPELPMDVPLPATTERSGERPLVLLVEDDTDVRRVVRHQLTRLGYPVLEAGSGDEALQMIDNIPDIRLVLSDVVMPGKTDGHALARVVSERYPELRIMLISGYPEGHGKAQPAGVALLSKPFTAEQLSRALERLQGAE